MILRFCRKAKVSSLPENITNVTEPLERCKSLFSQFDLSEVTTGTILLIISLFTLTACLFCVVKILHSFLKGKIAISIKSAISFNFPFPFTWVAGWLAILIGALMTFLVQSSSVFTSALIPLVGLGIISIKRMYPLTLGSNIGTTVTGLLAALAIPGSVNDIRNALQISLVHLFFNITGIILWYPIPFLRAVPINIAKHLGNTTAKYRWFAGVYILTGFVIFPGIIFALSLVSSIAVFCVLGIIGGIIVFVVTVKLFQKFKPSLLPDVLKTWKFLPIYLRSLEPYDSLVKRCSECCISCSKCHCFAKTTTDQPEKSPEHVSRQISPNSPEINKTLPRRVSFQINDED